MTTPKSDELLIEGLKDAMEILLRSCEQARGEAASHARRAERAERMLKEARGDGLPHTAGAVFDMVFDEMQRARSKFPSNEHLLAALMEEVGELAQALLDGHGRERVVAEAIQVACVAVRIVEEGDSSFNGGNAL